MELKSKITIESYNKTAEKYYKTVTNFDMLPELNEFLELIHPDSKILDLGCGPGHHSKFFRERGFDVTGIDLSTEMIKIAKREVKGVDFKVMDILNMTFNNETFDAVWASASLLHIAKQNIQSTLLSIRQILKKGGHFYLSLKEGQDEYIIKDDRYSSLNKFYSFFTVDEIHLLLKNVGFDDININVTAKRNFYDTNPWLHIFCVK